MYAWITLLSAIYAWIMLLSAIFRNMGFCGRHPCGVRCCLWKHLMLLLKKARTRTEIRVPHNKEPKVFGTEALLTRKVGCQCEMLRVGCQCEMLRVGCQCEMLRVGCHCEIPPRLAPFWGCAMRWGSFCLCSRGRTELRECEAAWHQ